MGGLLYKDFISVNRIGKVRATWIMTIFTLLYIVFRIAFPGTREIQEFMVPYGDGDTINLLDAYFIMAYGCYIVTTLSSISVAKIMNNDEKNKIRSYLDSMPIGKNTYVASKYIFLGIAAYVSLSMNNILGVICAAFCREGILQDIAAMTNSFVLNIVSITLFVAAIELPLYFSIGREKAMRVMVVFWTIIAFVVIGFLMFGDLSVVSGWDITVFMKFIEKHQSGVIIFQDLQPVIVLGLYFVSYQISCRLYYRKER